MTKKIPLASIHRKLAWNLAGVALLLCVVFSGVAFYTRWHIFGNVIEDRAKVRAAYFGIQAGHLLDTAGMANREELNRTLASFLDRFRNQDLGRYVHINFYDTNGSRIAEYSDDAYPDIDAVKKKIEAVRVRGERAGEMASRFIVVGGKPHVLVNVPIVDAGGGVIAFGEGGFSPSKRMVRKIRRGAIVTVLATVACVLLTALILYPVIVRLIRRVTGLSMALLESHMETLNVLGSAIAKRDSDTDAHNYRVTLVSVRIAEALGMVARDIRGLIKGAFLHDVGKIGIPDHILLKRGGLTDEEYKQMKTHVAKGMEIVGRSEWLRDALWVVGEHHEKVDGSGYPRGLKNGESSSAARIFAIADVFDALTSKRPYKEPFPFEKTMEILREGRGKHFDADFLDCFEGIAAAVYREISGKEIGDLRQALGRVVKQYFANDPGAMTI